MKRNKIFQNVLNNKFTPRHYSKQKLQTITQSDLAAFTFWLDCESLVKHGLQHYALQSDPNVIVFSHCAYNLYTKTAYNHFEFLKEYFDLSFPQAAYLLNYFYYKVNKAEVNGDLEFATLTTASYRLPKKNDTLPVDLNDILEHDLLRLKDPAEKHRAFNTLFAYLLNKRCVDRDIIINLVKQGFIAMDEKYNLCFLTYSDPLKKDDVIAITRRGTGMTAYKNNMVKEHHTGFLFAAKPTLESKNPDTIYIFESCIDLLSYLTLSKRGSIPHPSASGMFIALNGADNRQYIHKVLERYPSIRAVRLCLDTDSVGLAAAKSIAAQLTPTFNVTLSTELQAATAANGGKLLKDWNELLCHVTAKAAAVS